MPGSTSARPTVVVCAYGLLIPEALLAERLWLNVHPSLLPRWRGAAPVERAILAGDAETGVTIHETVKELDAGPIAAQERFPIGAGRRRRRGLRARGGASPRALLDAVLAEPSPVVRAAERRRRHLRRQDRARRSRARPRAPADELVRRVRALSPHIGARAELHGRPVTVWRARVGEDGRVRAARGAAGRRQADGRRRLAARPALMAAAISPARAAAFDVIRRVFEDEAYADRALRTAHGRPRRPRPRARAAARLRHGAARAHARPRDRDRSGGGRCGGSTPPVRAALRLGAFQLVFLDGVPRYAAVNESVELVRRARLERAVPFANAVLRRLADEGRARASRRCRSRRGRRPPLAHSYPDWVAETWWRDLGAEGALALMRAQNEAPATVVRLVRGEIDGVPDPDVPGAWHVEHVDEAALRGGPGLAAERRLAARRARASARSRASGCSTSAPRREARRRCSPARSSPSR